MLKLIAVLAVGLGVMSAFADTDTALSPMAQFDHGIPLEQILYSDFKVLLESPCITPSLGGINTAHAQELTAEQETQIDEVGKQIVQLQQDNIKYEQLPDTPEKAELIARNLDRVEVLLTQLDAIVPPDPTVEITDQLKEQMDVAMTALMESELPLLELYISSSNGLLTITVDKDESTDLESGIRDLIGQSLPIEIRYGSDNARFQGSCSTTTDFCDPLIGCTSLRNHLDRSH